LAEAFELIDLTTETIPDSFVDDFERTGDAKTYATRWTDVMRAVFYSVYHKGLSVPSSKNEADAECLTDTFFGRFRDELSARAGHVNTDFYSVTIVLRRR
jgi:hypothetical protein